MQTRRQLLTSVGALVAAPALAALPVSTRPKPYVFARSFCHVTEGYKLVADIYRDNKWVGAVVCLTDPGNKDFAWKNITWMPSSGTAFTRSELEEMSQAMKMYNRAFCQYFEKHQ